VRYFFNQVWQFVFASESANLSISKSKKGDYFEVVDNQFRFLARISPEYDARNYQFFVLGVVRGALTNLGIDPSPKVEMQILLDAGRQYPAIQLNIRCG
jgi:hypothetical protein